MQNGNNGETWTPDSELRDCALEEALGNLSRLPDQASRVFHGRGKSFPGYEDLNLEWYPPYLFVQNFHTALSNAQFQLIKQVFEQFPAIEAVLLQSRKWPDFSCQIIHYRKQKPELPVSHWVKVSPDLEVQVILGRNRNTGVFLDMRAGWDWVRNNSRDKVVLNLFSYTSIFSLFALAGGASSVENIDMAANVLKIAQRNHQHNGLHSGKAKFLRHNIIKSIRRYDRKGPFDLIILDPPPYQGASFRGWKDYQKLLAASRHCLKPGGQMLICLNHPATPLNEFIDRIRNLFPDVDPESMTPIATAPEIKEKDPQTGLKTLAVSFPDQN